MSSLTTSQTPPRSLWVELRSLPRVYWVLVCGIFINRCGSFVYPFLTIILTRRQFPDWEIGLALGGYGLGGLLATLVGGWCADRFGRKRSIMLGTFGHACCIWLMGGASTLPAMLTLTSLAGFSVGFFGPAASALVADVVPPELHLRAFAGTRLAINAGFAFGTALGGLLIDAAPQWLFWGDALTTASYGLVAALLLPHGTLTSKMDARWSEAWRVLRADRRFIALFVAQAFGSLIYAQFSTTYERAVTSQAPPLTLGAWLLPAAQIYGILVAMNGVWIIGCEMPLTRWVERFPARRVMAVGHVLLGTGFAVHAFVSTFVGYFLCMTVFTLGEMLCFPLTNATVTRLAPERMRGRYLGALSLAWALGNLLGPTLGFALYGWHPAALWSTCLGCGLAAAWMQWRSVD